MISEGIDDDLFPLRHSRKLSYPKQPVQHGEFEPAMAEYQATGLVQLKKFPPFRAIEQDAQLPALIMGG